MPESRDKRFIVAAAVTGFGLSGFFDGILLHQVLQWHHLLSLVPGETLQDLRTQILADGLFHVLMYLVTALGLWLMWRARDQARASGWRTAVGGVLLGFGAWNVVDVAFFHWILGIHRIRVDVPDPLLYDLVWLAAFGIVPLILGWIALRGRPHPPRGGAHALLSLTVLAIAAGAVAALPQSNARTALVVLAPGSTAAAAFNAAVEAGTPIVWADPVGGLMVVRLVPGSSARLYSAGAMLVTRSPVFAGCVSSVQG